MTFLCLALLCCVLEKPNGIGIPPVATAAIWAKDARRPPSRRRCWSRKRPAVGLAAGEGRPPFLARFERARRPRLGDAGVDAAGGVARAGDTVAQAVQNTEGASVDGSGQKDCGGRGEKELLELMAFPGRDDSAAMALTTGH
ncbi:hypothetical protein NL676_032224 [Syzygium grande]|nr:hypothetical protein NL676_032224 [Syzygium grande]